MITHEDFVNAYMQAHRSKLNYTQLAKTLGINVGTVRSWAYRLKKAGVKLPNLYGPSYMDVEKLNKIVEESL